MVPTSEEFVFYTFSTLPSWKHLQAQLSHSPWRRQSPSYWDIHRTYASYCTAYICVRRRRPELFTYVEGLQRCKYTHESAFKTNYLCSNHAGCSPDEAQMAGVTSYIMLVAHRDCPVTSKFGPAPPCVSQHKASLFWAITGGTHKLGCWIKKSFLVRPSHIASRSIYRWVMNQLVRLIIGSI